MAIQADILDVKGMSCEHCVARVKKAAGSLGGVSRVDVELKTGKVTVEFDAGEIGIGEIKEAIRGQGYEVK